MFVADSSNQCLQVDMCKVRLSCVDDVHLWNLAHSSLSQPLSCIVVICCAILLGLSQG
jgi:hypothetical protein